MVACLKALKSEHQVELLVIRWPSVSDAPFDESGYSWIDQLYLKSDFSVRQLEEIVQSFDPDAVLMPGWIDRDYLRVAHGLKSRGVLVIAGSDTQWKGSFKQRLAALVSRVYLHASIDVLWVASGAA